MISIQYFSMLVCIIKIAPSRVSGCLSTKTKNKSIDRQQGGRIPFSSFSCFSFWPISTVTLCLLFTLPLDGGKIRRPEIRVP